MPTGKLAKWKILLNGFDIIYVTQKAVKGQASADHLAENPVDGEYEPLNTYFPDEDMSFVGEDITEAYNGWRMFFDEAANFKGVGIRAILVSGTGQHYPVSAKLRFKYTNNIAEYEACIFGLRLVVDMNVQKLLVIGDSDLLVHQVLGEWATKNKEFDKNPWFHDIKEYLEKGEYLENATHTQKRTLQRLSSHFFQSGGTVYRRTTDLGLLRCVNAKEASRLLEEIHARTCRPHMYDFILAKKILRVGIKHQNSTAYRSQMNGAIEDANKNIKKILRKIVDNYRKWHEKLPFAFLEYCTTIRTSTGATPYLLVYGTEVAIPAKV
ncbi:uncharacterized protein [Nicotiana tomentosiformis]|uniref:uncharacterized protein n=1 Tax=Nicotiana tomentosiformis TaxID=4098 RepID=UPI00388CAD47